METTQQQATQRPAGPTHKKRSRIRVLPLISIMLIAALAVTAGVFYKKYQDLKSNPSVAANQQTEALVKKVGGLLELPKDETPTIATVEDKNKLKDQPFFKSAENGDKILIYTNARKAIVYRPSSNKIINVGPIAINAASDTTKAQ